MTFDLLHYYRVIVHAVVGNSVKMTGGDRERALACLRPAAGRPGGIAKSDGDALIGDRPARRRI